MALNGAKIKIARDMAALLADALDVMADDTTIDEPDTVETVGEVEGAEATFVIKTVGGAAYRVTVERV